MNRGDNITTVQEFQVIHPLSNSPYIVPRIPENGSNTASSVDQSCSDDTDEDTDSLDSVDDSSVCMSSTQNTPQQRRLKRDRHSSRTITPESQQISPIHR